MILQPAFNFSCSSTILLKVSEFIFYLFLAELTFCIYFSHFLIFSHSFSFILQRGNTRLDAALDAMRPYGFPEELVQQMVGELLDVGLLFSFLDFSMLNCFVKAKVVIGSGFCLDCDMGFVAFRFTVGMMDGSSLKKLLTRFFLKPFWKQ